MTIKSNFDDYYYKEVAKMTGAGSWNINYKEKTSLLDPLGRLILNTPQDYSPNPKNAMKFYPLDEVVRAQEIVNHCMEGNSFDTTIRMLTYDKKEFWVRAVGEPLVDELNNIIGIRGVFQDINTEKLKELSLEKSVDVIASQNSRLFNFAHIVSHNLRSHSSNLQLTVELLNSPNNSEVEEKELKESLFSISESLNTTIIHLNEIVSVQSKADDQKSEVVFETILKTVKDSIQRIIIENNATILSDFSEVSSISYIPAYMQSILLNLVSNAIKYKHPDRNAIIEIKTFSEEGKQFLTVKDNGLGIDLKKFRHKLFNMYQTFHRNQDAVGIGLFITKNQVEALQGSISADSIVNEGTTFKIKF